MADEAGCENRLEHVLTSNDTAVWTGLKPQPVYSCWRWVIRVNS